MDWKNKLYFGDNLGTPRERVATESVDLIYLDPHFNSSAANNLLFKEKSEEESASSARVLTVAELLDCKEVQFREHRFGTVAKAKRKSKHQQRKLF